MNYETIKVRYQDPVCFVQIHRPKANNTINEQLIYECHDVIDRYKESMTVLIIEGLPEVFCFGADFDEVKAYDTNDDKEKGDWNNAPLYNLWLRMTSEPYITVSHVRGRVNAGGMGFVAASDIVIADETASFGLSELIFGIIPACVLPFLIRRTGLQRANYMALITQPVSVQKAYEWGVVDVYGGKSDKLLRKELLRLRGLPKEGIRRYKKYIGDLYNTLHNSKREALSTNKEVFTDPEVRKRISRFVETGQISRQEKAYVKDDVSMKLNKSMPELKKVLLEPMNTKIDLIQLKNMENNDLKSLNIPEVSIKEMPNILCESYTKENSSLRRKRENTLSGYISMFPELVQLNQIREGRPIFWLQPPGGSINAYSDIAEVAERPFYTIQARGQVNNRKPLGGMSAMAAYYIHIILSVQPEGPYDLGGFSGAGTIAYEVTRQLQELGHVVATVVMLDTIWAGQYDDVKCHSNKSLMLCACNGMLTAIIPREERSESLLAEKRIHCDDLDNGVDESGCFEKLIDIAKTKGIIKNEELFRLGFENLYRLLKSYDTGRFALYPLSDPKAALCYYFKNKSGIYILDKERPYNFIDQSEMNINHRNYWEIWQKQFPKFHLTDVNSTDHFDLLKNLKSCEVILPFCRELYLRRG